MPQTDLSKMKVADLKRELKQRGLTTTGNKTDLQDRLQTALIDGELSLEDPTISGEELDEDTVLTDEEEAKILDENELLKSPRPDLLSPNLKQEIDLLQMSSLPPVSGKKVVLKRQLSSTTINTTSTVLSSTVKENDEPAIKVSKVSERQIITIDDEKKDATAFGNAAKVSQLSAEERLQLRAKKFGIKTNATTITAAPGAVAATTTTTSATDVAAPENNSNKTIETDEKQIETLKKRAERFGCIVSSKMVKLNDEEKLLKRKQRFGDVASTATSDNTTKIDGVWAEKARLRLERFKPTQISTASGAVTTTNGK